MVLLNKETKDIPRSLILWKQVLIPWRAKIGILSKEEKILLQLRRLDIMLRDMLSLYVGQVNSWLSVGEPSIIR